MLDKMRQNASSWVIKALFAIIILAFIFAFGMGGMNNSGDPIIAYVNEEPITTVAFQQAYEEYRENLHRQNPNISAEQLQDPQIKQIVLSQLINMKLIRDEAARLGIGATDKEVSEGIKRIPAFQNEQKVFEFQRYEAMLRQNHLTKAQFEADFRLEQTVNKLQTLIGLPARVSEQEARKMFDWAREEVQINYLLVSPKDYVEDTSPSDEEISAFYDENKEKFTRPAQVVIKYITFTPEKLAQFQDVSDEEAKAYYAAHSDTLVQKEEVNARHILLKVEESADQKEVDKVLARIEKIRERALAGEDFPKLAQEYSEGPSAPNGGDLGWFGRDGGMVKAFEDAAFSLAKGEVSQPVRTRFGWHIIKIEDRKDPSQMTFEDVESEIKQILAEEKATDKLSDLLDQTLDQLASGMKIGEIADDIGVFTNESEPIVLEQIQQNFGMKAEAAKVLFDLPETMSTETPLSIRDGYIIAQKVKDIPPTLPPVSEVKAAIIKHLQKLKAVDKAREKAADLLAKARDGKLEASEKALVKTSRPFGRQGMVPDLGTNQKLVADAFMAQAGDWLPQTYDLPVGVVVASLDKRVPAQSDTWEMEKMFWLASITQKYQNEMFQSFLAELRSKAKTELVRQDLLN